MSMDHQHPLDQIKEIRKMMEHSSRFVSLSGWSGICAGLAALVGAWLAQLQLQHHNIEPAYQRTAYPEDLRNSLLSIAIIVFVVAFIGSFLFTYAESRKKGLPIWSETSKRLLWHTFLPIGVGGLLILKMIALEQYQLIAASCLIFYGLGLVNGSKYTLGEVRFLGYGQIGVGLIDLLIPGYSLYFWALGFGVLHIVYGVFMWWKYEKNTAKV